MFRHLCGERSERRGNRSLAEKERKGLNRLAVESMQDPFGVTTRCGRQYEVTCWPFVPRHLQIAADVVASATKAVSGDFALRTGGEAP